MSPTEGVEGSPARGAAKSAAGQGPSKRYPTTRSAKKEAAAAAATGSHGASRGCSAKRKAARDPASGRMPRPRATGKKAGEAAALRQWKRLSKGDIRWILARKPSAPPARFAALKRSNPELVPRPDEEADEDKRRLYRLAKAFYEMEERLPRLQEWVRAELNRKGYVELDDESAKRRAEAQALVDREWPAIEAKMKALILSEKEYRGGEGGDESSSDEGEGSDDSGSDEGEGQEED